MSRPSKVRIVEVSPRDGLQSEPRKLAVQQRAAFVRGLVAAGARHIEVGSFVSPKHVPQMAGTDAVFGDLESRVEGVTYAALTPNLRGIEDAIAAGVDEVAVFAAATESFSTMNLGCSIADAMPRFAAVCRRAQAEGLRVRGYVSVVMSCPYEGDVSPSAVISLAEDLLEMGCYEISLGDTIGRGDPDRVACLLDELLLRIESDHLAVHFHDTYGLALANVMTALDRGIATIDAAAGGIGGCPHAPGAAGNLATEDLIWLLDRLGIEHGWDLDAVVQAVVPVLETLEVESPSRVHQLHRHFAGQILKR